MDIVMGVSVTPGNVQLVLVDRADPDGTVDEDNFELDSQATEQVLAAIAGTSESAAESGYRLVATGVTATDPTEASALRDALTAMDDVMLLPVLAAAAALARSVGSALGYARTGLLFVQPDSASLAVVDSADGSITDVRRELLPDDDTDAVATLTAMTASVQTLPSNPDGLFVVGAGVDIGMIKSELDAATSLTVSAPGDPETALARGAALAAAQALLVDSSTAALAYAQDPGTGVVDPQVALAAALAGVSAGAVDRDSTEDYNALAYSADPLGDADAFTAAGDADLPVHDVDDATALDFAGADEQPERTPFLVALGVLTIFVIGVAALAIALALDIRPHATQRPSLSQHVVVPIKQEPPPAPTAPAPKVPAAHIPAPAAPAPVPAPAAPPAVPGPAVPIAPPPVAPVPVPIAPAPVPVPPIAPPPLPAPGPGMPGPGIFGPGPGIPGPGIPGPRIPGPGIPGLPGIIHGGGPHLPGLPGFPRL